MNELLIYGFCIGIGAGIVSIVWFYFTKNKVYNTAELEKEIEGLKKEKEGFERNEKTLRESLENERQTTAEQLKTINKIDAHKNIITQYTTTTEERNKLDKENIDLMKNYLEKLTGSSRFQGDVGEKILQNILKFYKDFKMIFTIYNYIPIRNK